LIFHIIQSIGIIASFLITLHTIKTNNKQLKVHNKLMVTQQHRGIWTITYQTDTLNRIFDSKADIVIVVFVIYKLLW